MGRLTGKVAVITGASQGMVANVGTPNLACAGSKSAVRGMTAC